MSYIVEYTTLSGKRIPILHKIFESAESAEAFGEQGVSSGNYRDYAVVEQDDKETLEKIAYHKRMNARHVAFANQAHAAGNTELRDQHKEAAKQHRRAQLDYEDGSPRAAQRSMDANIMSGLIIEAAPKMQGDWLKAQREKDRAHADAMGRHVKSGRKKSYTSTQRSLAQLRGEELPEGTDLDEASAKIACLECDEVSTAKAWEKNNGFCPKCKTSNQGVAESINEDISAEAHHMERDHEVQMARSDLYKLANYAIKLHGILKGISEEQGLEGWMQAKITKAADYLSSVFHALEYDELERSQSEPMPATESVEEGMTASQHRQKMIDKIKKSGAVKSGSMSKDEEKVEETTTAGAIATAPMPMGKMIKRKKK